MTSFQIYHETGTASQLVARGAHPPEEPRRLCVVCEVTDRAVVIGSTQPETDIDKQACAPRLGLSVVRRRSGGGAVLVAPGAQAWLDFYLPAGDPLYERDVGASFSWLGSIWAAALSELAPAGCDVSVTGPGTPATRWSRLLCFGGLGSGEVVVGGQKVVGMSQRRQRDGAWLFTMALMTDTSKDLVSALALGELERREALSHLAANTAAVSGDLSGLVEKLTVALS